MNQKNKTFEDSYYSREIEKYNAWVKFCSDGSLKLYNLDNAELIPIKEFNNNDAKLEIIDDENVITTVTPDSTDTYIHVNHPF